MNKMHNTGVATKVAQASDGIEVPTNARWLSTSGTSGIRPDGTLPETIEEQVEQVWRNIQTILAPADMEVTDIVKITFYLTRRENYSVCLASRDRFLGDARPAAMSSIVSGLIRPDFLVEAEVQAAK
ncbi:RidA family protein [Dictyobacter formicarum]|uniref:Enamine deaminase RidA n=1 Tax=Dictyobacter formicarum TaxID=2778368 RepID=A0ABQ3VUG7_9CHLR|nr:RidA family protein [Dictyobacter formicarum]GHO89927.1 enamine deaminase RidA [Dictyobacter formicarum]